MHFQSRCNSPMILALLAQSILPRQVKHRSIFEYGSTAARSPAQLPPSALHRAPGRLRGPDGAHHIGGGCNGEETLRRHEAVLPVVQLPEGEAEPGLLLPGGILAVYTACKQHGAGCRASQWRKRRTRSMFKMPSLH